MSQTMLVPTKSIFTSRTFWINAISFVALLLTALLDTDLVKQHPDVILYIGMVLNAINIWLRKNTSQPVTIAGNDVKSVTMK